MATTAWLLAGSASTGFGGTGDRSWGGPDNITSNDGVYATSSFSASSPDSAFSEVLRAYNFNFASVLPDDVTIDGIEFRIERLGESSGDGTKPNEDSIRLIDHTATFVGDEKATGGSWSSSTTSTYGGAADMWGTTLTQSNIEDSDFGIGITVEFEIPDDAGFGFGTSRARVDRVEGRIHYTPNSPDAPTNAAISEFSETQVKITWTDNATTETGYEIQRNVDAAGFPDTTFGTSGTVTVAANSNSYTDTSPPASGSTVKYRVRAIRTGATASSYAETGTETIPDDDAPDFVSKIIWF